MRREGGEIEERIRNRAWTPAARWCEGCWAVNFRLDPLAIVGLFVVGVLGPSPAVASSFVEGAVISTTHASGVEELGSARVQPERGASRPNHAGTPDTVQGRQGAQLDVGGDLPPRFESPGSAARARDQRESAAGADGGPRSRFRWPELVYGGNAVSVKMLNQVGFGETFLPRVRIGVQYDRQLDKAHWIHGGVAWLLDRASVARFVGPSGCQLDSVEGEDLCGPGTIMGVDVWVGYTHRFYIRRLKWLVPHAKGSIGFSAWKYPRINGARLQARESSWGVHAAIGGGARIFIRPDIGVGIDLDLRLGSLTHTDKPVGEELKRSHFQIGLQILPLVGEYRF